MKPIHNLFAIATIGLLTISSCTQDEITPTPEQGKGTPVNFTMGVNALTRTTTTDLATEYVAVDEDCLVDGQSFATAMNNVDIVGANIASFDRTADLATLAQAKEFPADGYAIGAKLVAKGSVNGNIELDILIEQA